MSRRSSSRASFSRTTRFIRRRWEVTYCETRALYAARLREPITGSDVRQDLPDRSGSALVVTLRCSRQASTGLHVERPPRPPSARTLAVAERHVPRASLRSDLGIGVDRRLHGRERASPFRSARTAQQPSRTATAGHEPPADGCGPPSQCSRRAGRIPHAELARGGPDWPHASRRAPPHGDCWSSVADWLCR